MGWNAISLARIDCFFHSRSGIEHRRVKIIARHQVAKLIGRKSKYKFILGSHKRSKGRFWCPPSVGGGTVLASEWSTLQQLYVAVGERRTALPQNRQTAAP